MNPGVKVSVIVPTYASGPGLDAVLADLVSQSLPTEEFEAIFVDDGSPDDTFERLQRFEREHRFVRALQIAPSGWPSRPRNTALDIATGEYVFFLDHDDHLFPDALRRMYAFATEHRLDVLYPKEAVNGWNSPGWACWRDQIPVLDDLPQHILQCITPHKLYRRAFLEAHRIRFLEDHRRLEDFAFNGRALVHAERVGVLADTPCSTWNIGTDNIHKSGYDFTAYWQSFRASLRPLLDELPAGDRQDQLLVRWYRSRMLERLRENMTSWSPRYADRLFTEFADLVTLFPERIDRWLLPADRARSALLRRGDREGLLALAQYDAGIRLQLTTSRAAWQHGRLQVRLSGRLEHPDSTPVRFAAGPDGQQSRVPPEILVDRLPASVWDLGTDLAGAFMEIVLRHRGTSVDWIVPARAVLRIDDGALVFDLAADLDPATAAFGRPLADGLWDVFVRLENLGYTGTQRIGFHGGPLLPALLSGRGVVAYRTTADRLALDVGGRLHPVFAVATAGRLVLDPTDPTRVTVPEVHVAGRSRLPGRFPLGSRELAATLVGDEGVARIEWDEPSGLEVAPPAPEPPPDPAPTRLDARGRRADLDQASHHRDHLRTYQRELDAVHPGSIVIIAGRAPAEFGRVLAEHHPAATVHLLTVAERAAEGSWPVNLRVQHCPTLAELHRYLMAVPPPDAIIEDGSTASSHKVRCFRAAFLHLRDGGLYLAGGLHEHHLDRFRDEEEGVWEYLEKLLEARRRAHPHDVPGLHRDDVERAEAIERVTNYGTLVVVQRRGTHLVKVRDEAVAAVVAGRVGPGRVEELAVRPARTERSRCTLRTAQDHAGRRFPRKVEIPALHLRRYTDVVCAPRQLVLLDDVIPSIAFHHPLVKRLNNRTLVDISPDVTRLRTPLPAALDTLPGRYYHLDSEFPGHFGHFMTEDIGRLWGWREAKLHVPDLKLLVSTDDRGGTPPAYAQAVWSAYGIDPADVVCIDRPVRVPELIGASPMFHNGRYVHPELTSVWSSIRTALVGRVGRAKRKIFVTRPPGLQRSCHNAAEVEALFAAAGFEFVAPEALSMADQARTFASARVVAGYAGSGLLGTIFAPPGVRIVIGSESYIATNEWLIAGVQGGEYHHFFGRPDLPQPQQGWSVEAFHSDFTLDLELYGPALRELLDRR